jgi:hypothetical protein
MYAVSGLFPSISARDSPDAWRMFSLWWNCFPKRDSFLVRKKSKSEGLVLRKHGGCSEIYDCHCATAVLCISRMCFRLAEKLCGLPQPQLPIVTLSTCIIDWISSLCFGMVGHPAHRLYCDLASSPLHHVFMWLHFYTGTFLEPCIWI